MPPPQLPRGEVDEEPLSYLQNRQWQTEMSMNMHAIAPEQQGYYHCMVTDALNHVVNSTKSLVRFRGSTLFSLSLHFYICLHY